MTYSETLNSGGKLYVNGDDWYIEYHFGTTIRIAPWQARLYSSATLAHIDKYPVLKSFGITSEGELAAYQTEWKYADLRADDIIWNMASLASPSNNSSFVSAPKSASSAVPKKGNSNKAKETAKKENKQNERKERKEQSAGSQRQKPSMTACKSVADDYMSGRAQGRNPFSGFLGFICNVLAFMFMLKVAKRIFGFNTRRSVFSGTFFFFWFLSYALSWCWNVVFDIKRQRAEEG